MLYDIWPTVTKPQWYQPMDLDTLARRCFRNLFNCKRYSSGLSGCFFQDSIEAFFLPALHRQEHAENMRSSCAKGLRNMQEPTKLELLNTLKGRWIVLIHLPFKVIRLGKPHQNYILNINDLHYSISQLQYLLLRCFAAICILLPRQNPS